MNEPCTPLELFEIYLACQAAYKDKSMSYRDKRNSGLLGTHFEMWEKRPHCAFIQDLSREEIIELGKEVKERYKVAKPIIYHA